MRLRFIDVSDYTYIGGELDLFAEAENWKTYWFKAIQNYIQGEVLEVGAGVGNNSLRIVEVRGISITCLEPDPVLAAQLAKTLSSLDAAVNYRVNMGTTEDLNDRCRYNTILYIDVLEHIEDDSGELHRASSLLDTGGYLVVMAPALNWLYSPFDKAIGHYRRYNRSLLRKTAPVDLSEIKIHYMDVFGFLLSMANKLLLRQNLPTPEQIRIWDRWVVRASRFMDPVICYGFGKSILGVWQKTG